MNSVSANVRYGDLNKATSNNNNRYHNRQDGGEYLIVNFEIIVHNDDQYY